MGFFILIIIRQFRKYNTFPDFFNRYRRNILDGLRLCRQWFVTGILVDTCRLSLDIVKGLKYIHRIRILHKDLVSFFLNIDCILNIVFLCYHKSSNNVLIHGKTAKTTDFGEYEKNYNIKFILMVSICC